MAVTQAEQKQFEAEYQRFLDKELAAAKALSPTSAASAGREFVSALRDTGLRELTEMKEQLQRDARQSAVNVLVESGLPEGAAAAVMETGEALLSGKKVDVDRLARMAVSATATAACAATGYGAAVAPVCGLVAAALYSPIKNAFTKAFGGRTQEEIEEQRRQNALKAEAEKFYWAAKTAHDRKLTALLAFIEEGLRLWGARVVGKGNDAKLWYADPLIIKQDPFRTPVTGTSFAQKQLATQQLAFVNRFLRDIHSQEFAWMRDGDIKLEEVLINGKYEFRRAELYIKPAWRLMMVGSPPAWAVALRGQQLLDWAATAKRIIDQERAKKGADSWPVCLHPYAFAAGAAPGVLPGRMSSPPYAVAPCANSLYACRVDGSAVQCMPTGYGRTLHPPGNNLDALRFPLKANAAPVSPDAYLNNVEYLTFSGSAAQRAAFAIVLQAKLRLAANIDALAKTAAAVSYGGTNPVVRNQRAAAVQAEQYQAVLAAGGEKLREIAESKAQELTRARIAGLAAEAKIQGEAAAKTGAALTAEQQARADAEARAAASAARLRYLLAALAAAGAWYWYSSRKRGKRRSH